MTNSQQSSPIEQAAKEWKALVEESKNALAYLHPGNRLTLEQWHSIYDNAFYLFFESIAGSQWQAKQPTPDQEVLSALENLLKRYRVVYGYADMPLEDYRGQQVEDAEKAIEKLKKAQQTPAQPTPEIEKLLAFLAQYGGEIVSTAKLSPEWIEQARASGRLYVDEKSLGYVWEPDIDGFPTTEQKVEEFEKWYPLPVELPEKFKNGDWLFDKLHQKKSQPTPVKGDDAEERKLTKYDLGAIWEAAVEYEYRAQFGAVPTNVPNKEQYFKEKFGITTKNTVANQLKAAPKVDDLKSKEQIWKKWNDMGISKTAAALGAMEEYASQFAAPQAVKWVQAKDRLPGWYKEARWRHPTAEINELMWTSVAMETCSHLIEGLEWLDEGSTDKNET